MNKHLVNKLAFPDSCLPENYIENEVNVARYLQGNDSHIVSEYLSRALGSTLVDGAEIVSVQHDILVT